MKTIISFSALGTVSKSCAKKAVVPMAELVAVFAVHGLLSLFADVNCLLDPSGGSFRCVVDHRRIRPVYHVVFLQSMVDENRFVVFC